MVQESEHGGDRRIRIAIFEDLEAAIEIYTERFKGHGVELRFFDESSLDDSLREDLTKFGPDLLIVDLVLGQSRFEGYQLLQELHGTPSLRGTPVVVCSKLVTDAPDSEARRVQAVPGVVAALSKTPVYPQAEEFLRYAVRPDPNDHLSQSSIQ